MKEPMDTIVKTILVPILIAAGTVAYATRQGHKELSVGVMSNESVVDGTRDESLVVMFEGVRVSELAIVTFAVRNTGRVPIAASDFAEDLMVEVPSHVSILRWAVTDRQPSHLEPRVTATVNSLQIERLMLNPGDSFSVSTWLDSRTVTPEIRGRVLGVSQFGHLSLATEIPVTTGTWIQFLLGYSMLAIYYALAGRPSAPDQATTRKRLAYPLRLGLFVAIASSAAVHISGAAAGAGFSEWQRAMTVLVASALACPAYFVSRGLTSDDLKSSGDRPA
jgi:hypothetical protein